MLIKKSWNMLMSILYLGMGFYFLIIGTQNSSFPVWLNYAFGILMMAYGIFRLVRIFWISKNQTIIGND
jgi:uncharacterized membrane protein HdeD (DUF308 family)